VPGVVARKRLLRAILRIRGTSVKRAAHAAAALVQHMGVDHGGGNIGMAEQFLHRADVVTVLQKVRGERMSQHMRAYALDDLTTGRRRRA